MWGTCGFSVSFFPSTLRSGAPTSRSLRSSIFTHPARTPCSSATCSLACQSTNPHDFDVIFARCWKVWAEKPCHHEFYTRTLAATKRPCLDTMPIPR
jgi:hypothetical protein